MKAYLRKTLNATITLGKLVINFYTVYPWPQGYENSLTCHCYLPASVNKACLLPADAHSHLTEYVTELCFFVVVVVLFFCLWKLNQMEVRAASHYCVRDSLLMENKGSMSLDCFGPLSRGLFSGVPQHLEVPLRRNSDTWAGALPRQG